MVTYLQVRVSVGDVGQHDTEVLAQVHKSLHTGPAAHACRSAESNFSSVGKERCMATTIRCGYSTSCDQIKKLLVCHLCGTATVNVDGQQIC